MKPKADIGAVRASQDASDSSPWFRFRDALGGSDAKEVYAFVLVLAVCGAFGALIAFMGVNAAAFLRYFWRSDEKTIGNLVPPVLGFIICGLLWLNLSRPAMKIGAIWMAVGIVFGLWRTRAFTKQLSFEVPPEE